MEPYEIQEKMEEQFDDYDILDYYRQYCEQNYYATPLYGIDDPVLVQYITKQIDDNVSQGIEIIRDTDFNPKDDYFFIEDDGYIQSYKNIDSVVRDRAFEDDQFLKWVEEQDIFEEDDIL